MPAEEAGFADEVGGGGEGGTEAGGSTRSSPGEDLFDQLKKRRSSLPEDGRRTSLLSTNMENYHAKLNCRRGSTRQAFLVSEAKNELRELHR